MEQPVKIDTNNVKPCAELVSKVENVCDGVGIVFPPIMIDGKWKGFELLFTIDGKPDSIRIWDIKESNDTKPKAAN